MNPPPRPRVLIATAGFGDGHNSAARNLCKALQEDAEVLVVDPCADGAPRLNRLLRRGYRLVTNRLPEVWGWLYHQFERQDFRKRRVPLMRLVESALWDRIEEFEPDAIVSTYPLYPYFVNSYTAEGGRPRPLVTVVTDSLKINAAWRKANCDYWLVTDPFTREALVARRMPAQRVVDTGFPVDPLFSSLHPLGADDPAAPFRILFFPTSCRASLRRMGRTILRHGSRNLHLTVVLGHNVRTLYHTARHLREEAPDRVRLRGWSRRIPELLASHHLVIGKAGGATVHEALAASCPMLIHYLVPGQEEGNLDLLRRLGGGDLADSPESLDATLRDLLADRAAQWRRWKRNLVRHARPESATVAARLILDEARNAQQSQQSVA